MPWTPLSANHLRNPMIADAPTHNGAKQNNGTRKSLGIEDTYEVSDPSNAPIASDRPDLSNPPELSNLSETSTKKSAENFPENFPEESSGKSGRAEFSNLSDPPDAPEPDAPEPDAPDSDAPEVAVKRGISGDTDAQDISAMHNTPDGEARSDDELLANSIYNSDRGIWAIWAILLVIAVIALPFIARQGEILSAIADACMTLIGS